MLANLKRAMFGVSAFLLGLPVMVSAQWTQGITEAGSMGLPQGTVYEIIANLLSWLLAILGFIAIIGFVISGLMYLTASGDEGQAEKAKNAMKYSIIGIIVGLIGYVAVQAIDALLNESFF